mgnify:CR=1 FL=1
MLTVAARRALRKASARVRAKARLKRSKQQRNQVIINILRSSRSSELLFNTFKVVAKATSIDDFKILRKIGDGAQGTVYMVEKIDGVDKGIVYALKVYDKAKINEDPVSLDCLINERKVR